jgi:hypothetical protein
MTAAIAGGMAAIAGAMAAIAGGAVEVRSIGKKGIKAPEDTSIRRKK